MDKVISIESSKGPYQVLWQNIMKMVPERDRDDVDLQRLLAFRLRIDGESTTREYLMRKIHDMIKCAYRGRLYDFLKDDQEASQCQNSDFFNPPDIA